MTLLFNSINSQTIAKNIKNNNKKKTPRNKTPRKSVRKRNYFLVKTVVYIT